MRYTFLKSTTLDQRKTIKLILNRLFDDKIISYTETENDGYYIECKESDYIELKNELETLDDLLLYIFRKYPKWDIHGETRYTIDCIPFNSAL